MDRSKPHRGLALCGFTTLLLSVADGIGPSSAHADDVGEAAPKRSAPRAASDQVEAASSTSASSSETPVSARTAKVNGARRAARAEPSPARRVTPASGARIQPSEKGEIAMRELKTDRKGALVVPLEPVKADANSKVPSPTPPATARVEDKVPVTPPTTLSAPVVSGAGQTSDGSKPAVAEPVRPAPNRADISLRERVQRALAQDKRLTYSARGVSVDARDGEIVLSGALNTQFEKARAARVASRVPGARVVRDEVTVRTEPASAQ